jgi:hypothetical protein
MTAAASVTALSCGGTPGAVASRHGVSERSGAAPTVQMVTPSRLLPDLVTEKGVIELEDGHKHVLVDRMRVIVREDGTIERAAELFPLGDTKSIKLPSRLGGGFVFHANGSGGTQLWRAPSWLGKLEPLVRLDAVLTDVMPGFDRLYLRPAGTNQLRALDAKTGDELPIGPLPPSSSYGKLAFADGWRAVVDTDLRGPLATFDAGMTWRPIGIKDKERATEIRVISGDPTVVVAGGEYTVDSRGIVSFRANDPPRTTATDDADATPRPPGPFGKRPLRAAVEDGWPDSPSTAVVARRGALARISLRDGAVLEVAEEAFPERQASCHAVRMRQSFGFICGERDGTTVVYAFAPPLGLQPILRFTRPRFVAASGNGALIVRGGCSDESELSGDTRPYCAVSASGAKREVRVKGDLGVERVVALSDGRVAVLVPPRPGATGQVTLLKGSAMTSIPLKLPTEPRAAAADVRRGMWLEGFEERSPGEIAGWVEAGGRVVGVRVRLDGTVIAGEPRAGEGSDDAGVLVSGRFALARGDEELAESTDGGMTWTKFDLPDRDRDPTDSPTRSCGPVGCALRGWIRVGWGKSPEGDLVAAQTTSSSRTTMKSSSSLRLRCEAVSSVAATVAERPSPRAAPVVATPSRGLSGTFGPLRGASPGGLAGGLVGGLGIAPAPALQTTGWLPFRNAAAPPLSGDEIGFGGGSPDSVVSVRAYAWGRKGADWTRAGHLVIRFDDRFDGTGGVRSSSVGAAPWADEAGASEAVAATVGWSAFLDPSGRAALATACRGPMACALYAVAEAQPVLAIRDAVGRLGSSTRPMSAVRLGETWFYLAPAGSSGVADSLVLWRADLGVAREVATFNRPTGFRANSSDTPPRLVRRALGGGLGVLVSVTSDPRAASPAYYVFPIDPDKGAIGEAVFVGPRDLGGKVPDRCSAGQDGWQFDASPEGQMMVDVVGSAATLDGIALRLRLDPGSRCIDGIAATMEGTLTRSGGNAKDVASAGAKPRDADAGSAISLAATERGPSGRRWLLRCGPRGDTRNTTSADRFNEGVRVRGD